MQLIINRDSSTPIRTLILTNFDIRRRTKTSLGFVCWINFSSNNLCVNRCYLRKKMFVYLDLYSCSLARQSLLKNPLTVTLKKLLWTRGKKVVNKAQCNFQEIKKSVFIINTCPSCLYINHDDRIDLCNKLLI